MSSSVATVPSSVALGDAGDCPCVPEDAPPAPLEVLGRDVTVPLVSGERVEYAALDYAASAPALRQVWDDVAAYAPYYGSVHRGAGYLSQLSTEVYEQARRTVADFLDAREDDQVIFTRATTDSLNLLAHALPDGCEVYAFETEHHASLLPWRRATHATVRYLPAPESPEAAVHALDRALSQGDPSRPRLFCVTGASNVTGELWPVRELAAVAHRHDARIVLDAAQLAPHHPISLAAWDVDWVAFSGHKLYAPFGAGVLAGRADWLRQADPYLAGGGATRSVRRTTPGDLAVAWQEGVARHEAGSANVLGAHAIASACRALSDAGLERLHARETRLLRRLRDGLAAVPGLRLLDLFGPDQPRVAVLSFVLRGWDSSALATALSAEYGIGVRDGLFCAHPLVDKLLGVSDGVRPGAASTHGCDAEASPPDVGPTRAVRVSFGAGTPSAHVERLCTAVAELAAAGPWRGYRFADGHWSAQ